jgi:GT2 family glycosyltransferase
VRSKHPEVRFERVDNRGYGAGANRVFAECGRSHADAAFVLILNPDVILERGFAASLLRAMQARPRVALASGKLLRDDGRTLDSAGIRLSRQRWPRDRGSEQLDRGQFDAPELVFGVSGAAMLLRRSALADLTIEGEVFDEDFFAYYDDTDLAWRAELLAWQVLYEPGARAIHARRWRRDERMRIAPSVRRHSFKNYYLQIAKNERLGALLWNLPVLLVWELVRFGMVLARDRALIGAYADAARALPRALRKRRVLQARARARRAWIANQEAPDVEQSLETP